MYCSGTSFFVLLLNGGNKVRLQIKLIKKQSDLICGYMVWRCCGLTAYKDIEKASFDFWNYFICCIEYCCWIYRGYDFWKFYGVLFIS